MNSLERVLAAATFQGPDRPPVFLVLLQQGAIEMGLPLSDYYSHGDHIAEGQTRLIEKYGHDCVVGVPHIVEDTLPFGTELKYYDAGPPSVTGMSIKRYEQIPELKVPRAADHPQMRETPSRRNDGTVNIPILAIPSINELGSTIPKPAYSLPRQAT